MMQIVHTSHNTLIRLDLSTTIASKQTNENKSVQRETATRPTWWRKQTRPKNAVVGGRLAGRIIGSACWAGSRCSFVGPVHQNAPGSICRAAALLSWAGHLVPCVTAMIDGKNSVLGGRWILYVHEHHLTAKESKSQWMLLTSSVLLFSNICLSG